MAQNRDSFTQFELGKTLYHDTCINNNCYDAFKSLSLSAEQGNMMAQFMLADLYALGHGVDQNILCAHEWYTKSALQGYERSLIRIHNLYEEDKKIHCRGELDSGEEGMNEKEFKKKNNVRELYEYRLETMESKKLLGGTIEYFSKQFKTLKESNSEDKDTNYKLGFHYQYGYGVRKITKRAIECYTKAAEQGHVNAQYHLGCLYQRRTDIKFNYRLAFKWYTLAAEGGNSSAQNCLAFLYEKGLGTDIDFPKAIQWYTQASMSDNTSAKLNTAKIYRKGDIGTQDYLKSIKFYTEAAKKGNQPAINCLFLLNQMISVANVDPSTIIDLYSSISFAKKRLHSRLRFDISNLSTLININQLKELAKRALVGDGNAMLQVGKKYFNGSDFSQDKYIGFRWTHNAAKAGLVEAQLTVGKMYEDGEGDILKQDYYKASVWYFLAAKQKNHVALYKVGLMYYRGQGVRKDLLEASRWFTWSADRGNGDAQYMLGVLRLKGEGLSEDKLNSFQWFKKSATQKNPHALYQLGNILWTGEDFGKKNVIVKDKKRAIHFYTYAAQNGSIDSQMLLAKMYEEGNMYLKKNLSQAFAYYSLADKFGHLGAKYKTGCMYLYGTEIEKNYTKAFELIREAAKKGHYEAQCLFKTPIIYSDTIPDYTEILEMFKSATKNGLTDMEYNIGYAYECGLNHSSSLTLDSNLPVALNWYTLAEKKNHPSVFYRLGLMYEEGRGVPKSLSTAFKYHSKGAELKNPDSLNRLANMYLFGTGTAKNPFQAFDLFFEAANFGHLGARKDLALVCSFEKKHETEFTYPDLIDMIQKVAYSGNVSAQYKLGQYYELYASTVFTVEQYSFAAKSSAVDWYRLASQAKVTEACYRLGAIYEEEGPYHNYPKAIELYQTAMENKHDKALYRMARMYHYGKGVPRDYSKAFKLYDEAAKEGNREAFNIINIAREPARDGLISNTDKPSNLSPEVFKDSLEMYEYIADNGNVDLQYQVGYIYEKVMVPPEFEKAKHWYTISAYNSHEKAAYRLGKLYADVNGVSQNWTVASEYFNKAMKLGSSSACFEVGLMHYEGLGMMTDRSKGLNYFRQAANSGNPKAQYKLGQLYEEGEAVNIDLLEALRWYSKAYAQENNEAIIRLDTLHHDNSVYENRFNRKSFHIFQEFANRHGGKRTDEDPGFYGHMYFQLAYMHFNGISTKVDYRSAWKYFTIAIEEYHVKEASCFITEQDFSKSSSYVSLYSKKLEMLREMIDSIDRELLYDIGMMFYSGKHVFDKGNDKDYLVKPDYTSAFKFFSKISDQENLEVQRILGDMYYYGNGVEADHEKATVYHCIWASQQSTDENYQTGCAYYESKLNSSESKMIAFIYFNKAANERYPDAIKYLEEKYYSDLNSSKYMKKAMKIHECFATQQNSKKNIHLGIFYLDGSIPKTAYNIRNRTKNTHNSPTISHLAGYPEASKSKAVQKPESLHLPVPYHPVRLPISEPIHLHQITDPVSVLASNSPIDYRVISQNINSQNLSEFLQAYLRTNHSMLDATIKGNPLISSIYFNRAIEQKDYNALYFLEYIYSSGEYQSKYYPPSLGFGKSNSIINAVLFQLDTFSKGGNGLAQRFLGSMYFYGNCIKKDQKKAVDLYKKCANNLTNVENFERAMEYFKGSTHLKSNPPIALIFLETAIKQGSCNAKRYLGDLYYHGDFVDRNQERAYELHKDCASKLGSDQSFHVGDKYYRGDENVKKSYLIAAIYFERAVQQGNKKSYRCLGDMFYYGQGVKKNEKKAYDLHKFHAKQLSSHQSFNVGLNYYKGARNFQCSYFIAAVYFKRAAELGDKESRRYLGDMYYHGNGVDKNQKKARELHKYYAIQLEGEQVFDFAWEYQRDIENNLQGVGRNKTNTYNRHKSHSNQLSGEENFEMARRYYQGTRGLQCNHSLAAIYYIRAAELGSEKSYRHLADMYYYGDGVDKDQEKAHILHKYYASQIDSEQSFKIGCNYRIGTGNMKTNHSVAVIYFQRANELENTESYRCLGDMYFVGQGVEKNQRRAHELHKYYANQLDSDQSFNVGRNYYKGARNFLYNHSIAAIYFEKATELGNKESHRYLGDMYYHGDGVNRNQEKARELHGYYAKQLDSDQSFDVGCNYYKGVLNFENNRSIAVVYFERAAELGKKESYRRLGDIYLHGDGVEKNQEKPYELHEYYANQLNGEKNYVVGYNYHKGYQSFKSNPLISKIYIKKAAEQGHDIAKKYLSRLRV